MYKVVLKHFSLSSTRRVICLSRVWSAWTMWVSPRKGLFSGAPAAGAGDGASSPSAHLTLGKPFPRGFPGVKSCDRSKRRLGCAVVLLPKAGIGPGRGKTHSPAASSRLACLSAVSGGGQINLKQE